MAGAGHYVPGRAVEGGGIWRLYTMPVHYIQEVVCAASLWNLHGIHDFVVRNSPVAWKFSDITIHVDQ